jgi:hypothetical protein
MDGEMGMHRQMKEKRMQMMQMMTDRMPPVRARLERVGAALTVSATT